MTSLRFNSKASEFKAPHYRFFAVRSILVSLFILLAARLVYVQGFLRDELQDKANKEMSSRRTDSFHPRYRILDRNGLPLAETVLVNSCYVDPSLLSHTRKGIHELAGALNVNE